ncbi:hypothetical protein ACP4OV_008744 [Aristida adscensionis]
MAGQVMEAPPVHRAPMQQALNNCKNDHLSATAAAMAAVAGSCNSTTTTGMTAAEMAYLQQLQAAAAAEANSGGGGGNGGGRGEQCPRCASHDTKFCYYNNYNTSQPRHFCRACRRYWTLGGALRNVPIGGSTRKRLRLAPPPTRRPPPPPAPAGAAHHQHHHHAFGGGGGGAAPPMPTPMPMPWQAQGLLGSLFALGAAAPLLEGRSGPFDLGLALPGAGEVGVQMQSLGLRPGGGGGPASSLFWPAGLLGSDGVEDTWRLAGGPGAAGGAGAMWPELSPATPAAQAGGLLRGGGQIL